MKNFLKRWNNKKIEDWGSVQSDEAKSFYRCMKTAFERELKKIPNVNARFAKWSSNHYDASGFIEAKSGGATVYVYVSHSINRGEYEDLFGRDLNNHVLYRSAESLTDYKGGKNQITSVADFGKDVNGFIEQLLMKTASEQTRSLLEVVKGLKMSHNDVICEAEVLEEYNEYLHMELIGYSSEMLRKVADEMDDEMEAATTIALVGAQYRVGEYSIAGNYEDGYTVWRTKDGEDSDTLYDDISFENCILWCLGLDTLDHD